MNFISVIAIAIALAMDVFAVSVGISLSFSNISNRQAFWMALHFGLFQFLMPITGWVTGQNILKYIKAIDHWVAFGLLVFIGGKMIYTSFDKRIQAGKSSKELIKGLPLIFLSVATSIDALAVGLSFGVLHEAIFYPSVIIGLVAFLMTVVGIRIAPFLGMLAGKRAELAGGLILIFIGIKILSGHLQ